MLTTLLFQGRRFTERPARGGGSSNVTSRASPKNPLIMLAKGKTLQSLLDIAAGQERGFDLRGWVTNSSGGDYQK